MRSSLLITGLTLLIGAALASRASAQSPPAQYEVVDLGTLGGAWSGAVAIDADGAVVGLSQAADGTWHSFLWAGGTMTAIDLEGAPAFNCVAIGGGRIASSYNASTTTWGEDGSMVVSSTARAVVRQGSRIRDLAAGVGTIVTGIDATGDVVGAASFGQIRHAVLWRGGAQIDLGTLGGESEATAIAGGAVVGWARTKDGSPHPFVWRDGKLADLGVPPGDPAYGGIVYGFARAIDDRGEVAGEIEIVHDALDEMRAVVWRDGRIDRLPNHDYEHQSGALGIASSGIVVGWASGVEPRVRWAVVWCNGVELRLPSLGGIFSEADAVNASGWIIGTSSTAAGATHATLWRPTGSK